MILTILGDDHREPHSTICDWLADKTNRAANAPTVSWNSAGNITNWCNIDALAWWESIDLFQMLPVPPFVINSTPNVQIIKFIHRWMFGPERNWQFLLLYLRWLLLAYKRFMPEKQYFRWKSCLNTGVTNRSDDWKIRMRNNNGLKAVRFKSISTERLYVIIHGRSQHRFQIFERLV